MAALAAVLGNLLVLGRMSPSLLLVCAAFPILVVMPELTVAYLVLDGWTLERFSRLPGADLPVTPGILVAGFFATRLAVDYIQAGRRMPTVKLRLPLLTSAFLVYMFGSNWLAFGEPNVSLLNNLVFYWILLLYVGSLAEAEKLAIAAIVATLTIAVAGIWQAASEGIDPTMGVTAFYGNHVQPGFYAWLGVLLAWTLFISRPAGAARNLYLLAATFDLGMMVLSVARGVFVAAVVTAAYLMRRHRATLLLIPIVGLLFILAPSSVRDRFLTVFELFRALDDQLRLDSILSGRLALLDAAVNMFLASPIVGLGFGQFQVRWPAFTTLPISPEFASVEGMSAHSVYLNILADLGLVGLVMYLGLLGASFWSFQQPAPTLRSAWLPLAGGAAIVSFAMHGLLDNSGWLDRPFYMFLALASVWPSLRVVEMRTLRSLAEMPVARDGATSSSSSKPAAAAGTWPPRQRRTEIITKP